MTQAATLTQQQLQRVLEYTRTRRHYKRNRAIILLTHYAMLRVGEVAALRICDVLTSDGQIVEEIRLKAEQTKGSVGRTVLLSKKMQEELHHYLSCRFKLKDLTAVTYTDTSRALFCSQKNNMRGFSANTLAQHFHYIYKNANVVGASSHSGRRGFITNLANRGVSVRVLMELSGHKSIAVTQRYIDINPSMMRSAVEML